MDQEKLLHSVVIALWAKEKATGAGIYGQALLERWIARACEETEGIYAVAS